MHRLTLIALASLSLISAASGDSKKAAVFNVTVTGVLQRSPEGDGTGWLIIQNKTNKRFDVIFVGFDKDVFAPQAIDQQVRITGKQLGDDGRVTVDKLAVIGGGEFRRGPVVERLP